MGEAGSAVKQNVSLQENGKVTITPCAIATKQIRKIPTSMKVGNTLFSFTQASQVCTVE